MIAFLTRKLRHLQCGLAILYFTITHWRLVKTLLTYQIPQAFLGEVRYLTRLTSLLWPLAFRKHRRLALEQRFILAFTELGPIFIKFGQIISTRVDMLPDAVGRALAQLQDKVPAFSAQEAERLITHHLGHPLKRTFQSFRKQPIGSASLAQVHEATLHNGRRVIIKLLRPDIAQKIQRNLRSLYQLASIIDRFHPNGHIIRATAVVADYDCTIHNEMDFLIEAANCSEMYRHTQSMDTVAIPRVIWPHCRQHMLVTTFVSGMDINQFIQSTASRASKQAIALNLLMLFATNL